MTSAYVQSQRGHVSIEAFVGLLSTRANSIRLWLVDVARFAFCTFFAWKSWTLAHEAYVDGQVSNSMWSPPLAIPYGLSNAFGPRRHVQLGLVLTVLNALSTTHINMRQMYPFLAQLIDHLHHLYPWSH